jgi:cell division transport system permease protein
MRALDYAFRQGWTSLWRAGGSTLAAIAAIALALVVFGALLVVTWNAQRLVEELAAAAEFSVYLDDGITAEERGAVEAAIERSGVAEDITLVSKEEALATFRQRFAELASVTDALEENPFPASLEIQLRTPAGQEASSLEPLVRDIAAMPGVADVRYDREWLGRVQDFLRALNIAGFALGALMALAAAITVAAVVRLGLLARAEEIEIMELVGAPLAFIRGPFVAEGLLQGGFGAACALLVLGGLYVGVQSAWGETFAASLGGVALRFLPLHLCLYLLLGGMVVGGLGGLIASRHAGASSAAAR